MSVAPGSRFRAAARSSARSEIDGAGKPAGWSASRRALRREAVTGVDEARVRRAYDTVRGGQEATGVTTSAVTSRSSQVGEAVAGDSTQAPDPGRAGESGYGAGGPSSGTTTGADSGGVGAGNGVAPPGEPGGGGATGGARPSGEPPELGAAPLGPKTRSQEQGWSRRSAARKPG
nr:glycine-rich RNA-binding protein-like [Aegilops tauschii subsp. strangulata]